MDFHTPHTIYRHAKTDARYWSGAPRESAYAFYRHVAATAAPDDYILTLRTWLEHGWYANDCPYYNIWPQYAGLFARTNIDLPVEVMRPPFTSFAVNFSRQSPPVFNGHAVGFVIVQILTPNNWSRHVERLGPVAQRANAGNNIDGYTLSMIVGEAVVTPDATMTMLDMELRAGESIEVLLAAARKGRISHARKDDFDAQEFAKGVMTAGADYLWRVVLSTMFLATNQDKVVSPILINKHLPKYLEALKTGDTQAAAAAVQKSRKRQTGIGFSVGDTRLLPKEYDLEDKSNGRHNADAEAGRALNYQHQRSAHFHLYWTGPGRKIPKVKFVLQTTVRDDLPADPRERHYHLGRKPSMGK